MLERTLFTYFCALILISFISCNATSLHTNKSKNKTLFFRRSVEEIDDNATLRSTLTTDFVQDHLVSFMVKNVRDIFGSRREIAITDPDPSNLSSIIMLTVSSTVDKFDSASKINDNRTLESILFSTSYELSQDNATTELNLVKDLMLSTNPSENEETVEVPSQMDASLRRSCIFCDNVVSNNCVNPKGKLIPSTDCDRVDDMCYSMHTPFGVIERGCYNVNHNLTIYVCSCNLCNHLSITELPHMFISKRDWIDNVVELSRAKNLRKSIFKEMSCLRCQAYVTANPKDMRDGVHCFDGRIGVVPTQQCRESEICGIKAIKSEGYIWRGCLKTPLYNYWWTFCDNDFCNNDRLASIYDPE